MTPWSPIQLYILHFSKKAKKPGRRQAVGTSLAVTLPTPSVRKKEGVRFSPPGRPSSSLQSFPHLLRLGFAAWFVPPGG